MTLRRFVPFVAVLALAPALSSCSKHDRITEAETEGVYVDVDAMKYQVQISRQLNPSIPEDQTFLSGIAAADLKLTPDEAWFAVFVRIENDADSPQQAARSYVITDTEGAEYRPVTIGRDNPFHYVTAPVPAKSVAPNVDSVAAQTSIAGMELLFKVKRTSFDNKPLFLKIHSPRDFSEVAEVDLDV